MFKKEILPWIIFAIILAILFIMSSTDMIIKDREESIFPISVIIDDTSDKYFTNLKKGMDRAAGQYNVDINFITLYENKSYLSQLEKLNAEIENSARAIVLVPVDITKMQDDILRAGIPVIILGESQYNTESVSIDYRKAAAQISEVLMREHKGDYNLFILKHGALDTEDRVIYDSLIKNTAYQNIEVINLEVNKIDDKLAKLNPKEENVFFSLDKQSTVEISDIYTDDEILREGISSIYGLGSSTYILNKLEQGIVSGVLVWNEYEQGYIAIKNAVDNIKTPGIKNKEVLETYYINRENMLDKEFVRILYPID